MNSINHTAFYSKAELYDIAFSFKDIERENAFCLALFERLSMRPAASYLEIAAGPARNALGMAQSKGLRTAAIDLSADMAAYGRALALRDGIPLRYEVQDMRSFDLGDRFDLAALLMDSASYLRTDEDMLSHLQCVARNLVAGGVYILEMTHPRDVFGVGRSTQDSWTTPVPPRPGEDVSTGSVVVEWGRPNDPFDPIEQIRDVTATIRFEPTTQAAAGANAPAFEVTDRCAQRVRTYQELRGLAARSADFDWIGAWGDWDLDLTMSNAPESWRMIAVLRKIDCR